MRDEWRRARETGRASGRVRKRKREVRIARETGLKVFE